MSTQQIFYRQVVPVSPSRHRDLSVKAGKDFSFARKVNAVPLTAVEFSAAAAEYPIVFAGTEEEIFPAVVLGLKADENLHVSEDGRWLGSHIPAFVQRYPFAFSASGEENRFRLHIDEAFDGVNTEGRGERLFDSEGAQTQYLQTVLKFLQEFQARFQRTKEFCETLVKLELLQPMQARISVQGEQKKSLAGFMAVDRDRLKGLTDATAGEMLRRDELECLYLHLHSMRHFRDLAESSLRDPDPGDEQAKSKTIAEFEDLSTGAPTDTPLN